MTELEKQNAELRDALASCVKLIDSLLPQMGNLVIDIGLLNDTLLKARPLLQEQE